MIAHETIVNPERARPLNKKETQPGLVAYWMIRDKRIQDNWALLYALQLAKSLNSSLVVLFCYDEYLPEFSLRQITFMLEGLQQVSILAKKLNINFLCMTGDPEVKIPSLVRKHKFGAVVTDFFPLKAVITAQKKVTRKIDISMISVDAHNIVPCWVTSEKQEYAARTIRPKIKRNLDEYLTEFPRVTRQKTNAGLGFDSVDEDALLASDHKKIDRRAQPVSWLPSGPDGAKKVLHTFLTKKIKHYAAKRNNPTEDVLSNLSPYFHFGFLAPARAVLDTYASCGKSENRDTFLEEVIVRRELSDNFTYYNANYNSIKGCTDWAKKTLDIHARDKREYVYSKTELENADTHDELWNAAQLEMLHTGKMHGYMRMYWAKKILEWTNNPQTAVRFALEFNDAYELDGCDPNGYVGVLWSIGGLHDRAWFKRKIFGSIRYMSYNGAKSKFDVVKYIQLVKKKIK